MTTLFQVPFNISKGTATADAYRIAPKIDTILNGMVNAQGQLLSGSSYANYGPGMLMTPISTWNIVPYNSVNGNIVGPTPIAITGAGWLPLTASNLPGATTLVSASNSSVFPKGAPNGTYVQFDWPRVPTITLSATMTSSVPVTFFGTDWYGMPLQHTYMVEDEGTYGDSLQGTVQSCKAFYTITGIYFNGVTTNSAEITCQTSNIFGLPYVLSSYNDVMNFKWNGKDMLTQSGSVQVDGTTPVTIETPAAAAVLASRTIGGTQEGAQLVLSNIGGGTGTPSMPVVGAVTTSSVTGPGTIDISASAGDLTFVSWVIPNGGSYIINASDDNIPSGTTGDVRGLFQLPNPGETWAALPDPGTQSPANLTTTPPTPQAQVDPGIQAIFSWYVEGFDQLINILSTNSNSPSQSGQPEGAQPQGVLSTDATLNGYVLPNTFVNMFGNTQFYTGEFA